VPDGRGALPVRRVLHEVGRAEGPSDRRRLVERGGRSTSRGVRAGRSLARQSDARLFPTSGKRAALWLFRSGLYPALSPKLYPDCTDAPRWFMTDVCVTKSREAYGGFLEQSAVIFERAAR